MMSEWGRVTDQFAKYERNSTREVLEFAFCDGEIIGEFAIGHDHRFDDHFRDIYVGIL
jgi:hypothetical protein